MIHRHFDCIIHFIVTMNDNLGSRESLVIMVDVVIFKGYHH